MKYKKKPTPIDAPSPKEQEAKLKANLEGALYCAGTAIEILAKTPLTAENIEKVQHAHHWLREIKGNIHRDYLKLMEKMGVQNPQPQISQ